MVFQGKTLHYAGLSLNHCVGFRLNMAQEGNWKDMQLGTWPVFSGS